MQTREPTIPSLNLMGPQGSVVKLLLMLYNIRYSGGNMSNGRWGRKIRRRIVRGTGKRHRKGVRGSVKNRTSN